MNQLAAMQVKNAPVGKHCDIIELWLLKRADVFDYIERFWCQTLRTP